MEALREIRNRGRPVSYTHLSCITNLAAGMTKEELNHAEVQETADRVAKQFKELITGIISRI